jgi:hypothetical protein
MPTNTAQPAVQTSIVAAGTSPVTLSIPPVSEPLGSLGGRTGSNLFDHEGESL